MCCVTVAQNSVSMAIELVLVVNVLQGEIQNRNLRKLNAIRCRCSDRAAGKKVV